MRVWLTALRVYATFIVFFLGEKMKMIPEQKIVAQWCLTNQRNFKCDIGIGTGYKPIFMSFNYYDIKIDSDTRYRCG
jgi:hypothetical protein